MVPLKMIGHRKIYGSIIGNIACCGECSCFEEDVLERLDRAIGKCSLVKRLYNANSRLVPENSDPCGYFLRKKSLDELQEEEEYDQENLDDELIIKAAVSVLESKGFIVTLRKIGN